MAEEKRAVILFADILGSTEFAGTQTRGRYNDMLRAFQRMAHDVIESYKKAEGLGNERVHAGGVGDECHVFLVGGRRNEDECHAMRLAVRLKQGWMNSDFGKRLTELSQNPYGTKVDLRVGIGCGEVVFDRDVWTRRSTPEGFYISQAKRIESLAEKYAKDTLILVKLEIKEAVQEAEGLDIGFGPRPDIPPGEAKGLIRGNDELHIYPVLRYAEFAAVQQQTTPHPSTALEYALLALALQRSGNLDGAISNYREAVKLEPDLHEAWNNMGIAHDAKGEYDRAIECYQKAVDIKPDLHEAWNNMGIAYWHKEDYDQAIEYSQKALVIKPDYQEAWRSMGVAHADKGEYDRAIECYQKALDIKPDEALAWFNMACAHSLKRETGPAVENLTRAISLDEQWREDAKTDSDFDPIRNDPAFRKLVYGEGP